MSTTTCDNPILKFLYISGGSTAEVDFDKFEVNKIGFRKNKKVETVRLQDGSPYVYEFGKAWESILLWIDPANWDTLDRINTLKDVTAIMTMLLYYADGTTLAENKAVRVNPNVRTFFQSGVRDGGRLITIELFEADSGNVFVEFFM